MRRRCELITVKRSGHRIITTGPHMRGEEEGSSGKEARKGAREEAKQNSREKNTKQRKKLHFCPVVSRLGEVIAS